MTEPIQKKYEPSKEEIEIQKFIDENTIPATPVGAFHQDPGYKTALEGKSYRNLINTPLIQLLKNNIVYTHLSQAYEPTFFTEYNFDKVYGIIEDKNPLIKNSTYLTDSIDAATHASHQLLDTKTNTFVVPNSSQSTTTVIEFNTMPNKNENKKSYNMCIKHYRRFNAPFNYKEIPIGHQATPNTGPQFKRYSLYSTLNNLREEAIYTSNMNHLIYHLFRSYVGNEFQEYRVTDDMFDLIMKNISDIITRQMLIIYYNARTEYQKKIDKDIGLEMVFDKEFLSALNNRIDSASAVVKSTLGYCENNNKFKPFSYEELLIKGSQRVFDDSDTFIPRTTPRDMLKKATEFICDKDVWGSLLKNIIKSLSKQTAAFIEKQENFLEVPYIFIIRGTTKGQDYFNYSDVEYYSANRVLFGDLQYAIIPDNEEYKLSDILTNKL